MAIAVSQEILTPPTRKNDESTADWRARYRAAYLALIAELLALPGIMEADTHPWASDPNIVILRTSAATFAPGFQFAPDGNPSIRLINIVNDFLDSSRLEQGKITFDNQPFDVVPLIHQLLRQYDVTGSRRKLYLRVEPSPDPVPLVVGDADRTRQIITNLLGNAIRSTQKGGVSIKFSKRLGNLAIEVTDTGHGIPVESQHLLFHKFQQASHDILTRDSTHGTGLGLYISSLLAEGMEGELYLAHTEEGKGSTFVLELPIAKR